MAEELNEGRVAYLEALVRSLNDTIGELRAELSETRAALEAERLDRYGAVRDRDLLLWLHAEAVWHREQAVMEEALRWRKIVEQWEQGHQNEVLPYTAKLEADRDLLLWLHAEAVHLNAWYLKTGRIQQRWVDELTDERDDLAGRLAASQLDLLARGVEIDRLRREAQFELHGINVDMEDFFIHVNDRVEFVRPDGRRASGVVVDVDPARVLADDTGNVTSNPIGLSKKRPCACLPEGAVLPAGWSLPQCAVHQDGGTA